MRILILFFALCLPLNACGIKPSSVEQPNSAENARYPSTYPKAEGQE